MTMNELRNKLSRWIDNYGATKESLNDFANMNATSYEEYMAISEMLDNMFGEL